MPRHYSPALRWMSDSVSSLGTQKSASAAIRVSHIDIAIIAAFYTMIRLRLQILEAAFFSGL
jgi:hypothetical protein